MKVSEITTNSVADFIRADDSNDPMLIPMLATAKKYVSDFTKIAINDVYFVTEDIVPTKEKSYYTLNGEIYTEFVGVSFEVGTTYYEKNESLDDHEDFWLVIMVLCQDMYDNRCLYVDKNNINKVVDSILYMHCKNFI